MNAPPAPRGLQLVRPPYTTFEPLGHGWQPAPCQPGAAVVWFMSPTKHVYGEMEWAWARPRSIPLFVVLPDPEDVPPLAPIVGTLPDLDPRGVLPAYGPGTLRAVQTLLAAPPRSMAQSATQLLDRLGHIPDPETFRRVQVIFARASHTRCIEDLAVTLCQSRRTLGRFFAERGLPVPSHWLQFGRLLHVSVQLQNSNTNIGRVATRFGYTDGFTMSNSMKRLTGYRPSDVRKNLGWEWLVAAWIREERRN
jgi:AraC-like DNA-binding protein